MKSSNLTRRGGPAAILGGVLFCIVWVLLDGLAESGVLTGAFFESHWGYHVLDVPAKVLLAVGVLGLFFWLAASLGKLGKIGAYLALAGFALAAVGGLAIMAFELGVGTDSMPELLDMTTHLLAALLFVAGSILFGVAALAAGVLPRGGALLITLAPITFFGMVFGGVEDPLLITLGLVFFGAGWAWLGYALLSQQRGEPDGQATQMG